MQGTQVGSLGQEDFLEKEMAAHSNILARRILGTEEPSGLSSTGSQTFRHNWPTNALTQRRKTEENWQGRVGGFLLDDDAGEGRSHASFRELSIPTPL